MRNLTRLALVASSAFALVIGFGTTASAGTDQEIKVKGGAAWWTADGDTVTCFDSREDGYGVRAYARTGMWTIHADCKKAGVINDYTRNFVEGSEIKLQLCYTKGGEDIKCSLQQDAVA